MNRNETVGRKKDGKRSDILFWLWLLLYTAAMAVYSCHPESFTGLSAGKTMGIFSLTALDLLSVLMAFTGNIYWNGCVSGEEAAAVSKSVRRRCALRQLAVFSAVTVLFLLYCFVLPGICHIGGTWDSLAAGAAVCVGAVGAGRVKLS